uniref:Alpha-1,3-mannosyl-glycoprotein 4-beta-N-acetylglucosaminyltransferase B n=2 Tax=Cacopsylla melanoneura TaxID=428564 RepID=A0A8D8MFH9_9HEMI
MSADVTRVMASNFHFPIPRRRHLLFGSLVVFLPCSVFIVLIDPDLSTEESHLIEKIAHLQLRLSHLDALYRTREYEAQLAANILHNMSSGGWGNRNLSSHRSLIQDLVVSKKVSWILHQNDSTPFIRPPSVYQFLPHLLDNPHSMKPALLISKRRTGVSLTIGLPTVKRLNQTYVFGTLKNVLDTMNLSERNDCVVIVFIAEPDEAYVTQVANEILAVPQFVEAINAGLVDILAPHASYYPDFSRLRPTLGDSIERVRWRSKQNLDFAYLMMFAQERGLFYIQLEDDVLAKDGFVSRVKKFAFNQSTQRHQWFVLDFCQLGFIGKLFRSTDLPALIQIFLLLYNDKPVDWLLEGFISLKLCSSEKDQSDCKKRTENVWIHHKPSLFQHIGTVSSLKGKVQKLKDKQFGKIPLFFPHNNPSAEVGSTIKAYKLHTLKRAYLGETFFWGLLPQPNDILSFRFRPPGIKLKRFMFRSGNAEHPSDMLYNTSVVALLADSNETVTVGKFNNWGMVEEYVPQSLDLVAELQLIVLKESDNWVILSEIQIDTYS